MAKIFVSKSFDTSNRVRNSRYNKFNTNSIGPVQLSNVLEPTNGFNDMDVVKKFNWTLTPLNDTTTKEVPYIKLTEYYLLDNYLNQLFKSYGSQADSVVEAGKAFLNPFSVTQATNTELLYQGLYDHDNPTGFTYKFPYFSQDYLSTSNSWTAKPMFQEITNLQKKIVGYGTAGTILTVGATIAGVASIAGIVAASTGGGAPVGAALQAFAATTLKGVGDVARVGKSLSERGFELTKLTQLANVGLQSPIANLQDPAIDKPHIWSTTTPRSFNVTFPLYNTLTQPKGKSWNSNILQNWELCYLLSYQNLYNKRNLFTGIPPVFYEIDIPGIHYSKAGYISNLQILNAGNIRAYKLPIQQSNTLQDVNVPDAYIINMTITDFFIPSKNFMSALCTKDKSGLPINQSSFNYANIKTKTETNKQTPDPHPASVSPWRGGGDIICWVAREVYGDTSVKWIIFRDWLFGSNGPVWLQKIYIKYGKQFAAFISNKPLIKRFIKQLMDIIVNKLI